MDSNIQQIKQLCEPVFRRFRIKRAGVFGSYARGEQRKDSDVDLLVEMDLSYDLLDFIKFKRELENSLSRKVDVVEYSAIKPVIRQNILNSEVVIYEPQL